MLCAWRKKEKKSIIKISSLTNIKISPENPPHYTAGGHDFIAPVGYSYNTYLHSIITSTFIVEWLFIVMRWFWFYHQRPPCTRALQEKAEWTWRRNKAGLCAYFTLCLIMSWVQCRPVASLTVLYQKYCTGLLTLCVTCGQSSELTPQYNVDMNMPVYTSSRQTAILVFIWRCVSGHQINTKV